MKGLLCLDGLILIVLLIHFHYVESVEECPEYNLEEWSYLLDLLKSVPFINKLK